MSQVQALHKRVRRYQPILESIIFGLSLLGLLDVVHLYLQQNRGFEQGCFGFSTLKSGGSVFNCAAVTSAGSSSIFGVSNITLGAAFYLFVAVLTVVLFWVQPSLRSWLQYVRTGVLSGGVLYSGYLVYLQVGPLGAFCALCLVSAFIVALLFGVQIATFMISPSSVESPMSSPLLKRQIAIFAYIASTALVLIGADVTYFGGLGKGSTKGTARSMASSVSGPSAQCRLDTAKDPVAKNGQSLVGFGDITKGNADAEVTIIEYFDPNCPHCKDFHDVMKKLVDAYKEEVLFVFKPFPLRASSLPEIQALYVANRSGKFTEMLEAQYRRQGRGGINESDLRAIAKDLDMDPGVLMNRIDQNEYREQVVQMRKRAIKIGVTSTPTVLVNGHFVQSRSLKCMKSFIEQAKAGTLGPPSSK